VTNFDSDLCDSLALAALLISHWPELASFVSQLKLSPGNQAGMRYNAGTLVKMMEELQLPWTLQVPFYFLLSSVAIFKSMGVQNRLSIGGEWFVLHADVLCCAVLCCAVLCCAVLCCAVLCCCTRRTVAHTVYYRFFWYVECRRRRSPNQTQEIWCCWCCTCTRPYPSSSPGPPLNLQASWVTSRSGPGLACNICCHAVHACPSCHMGVRIDVWKCCCCCTFDSAVP